MASQIQINVAMVVIIGETTVGGAFKNYLILWAYFGYGLKWQGWDDRERKHGGCLGCIDQEQCYNHLFHLLTIYYPRKHTFINLKLTTKLEGGDCYIHVANTSPVALRG